MRKSAGNRPLASSNVYRFETADSFTRQEVCRIMEKSVISSDVWSRASAVDGLLFGKTLLKLLIVKNNRIFMKI